MIHRRHPHMLFVTVSISLLMTELSRELICAGGGARQEIDPHRLVGRRDRDHRVDRVHQGRCAASRTVKLTPSSRPHPATPPLPFPSPSPTPGVCFAVQKRARIAPSPRALQPTPSSTSLSNHLHPLSALPRPFTPFRARFPLSPPFGRPIATAEKPPLRPPPSTRPRARTSPAQPGPRSFDAGTRSIRRARARACPQVTRAPLPLARARARPRAPTAALLLPRSPPRARAVCPFAAADGAIRSFAAGSDSNRRAPASPTPRTTRASPPIVQLRDAPRRRLPPRCCCLAA